MNLTEYFKELADDVKRNYEESVTMEEAERLAAKFLYAQMQVSEALRESDLDSRMRKSGLKAIKAAVYMEACSKAEKKPSDTYLENVVNTDPIVATEQDAFDKAEVYRDFLQNQFNVFREAHIHFRSIAKGRFE